MPFRQMSSMRHETRRLVFSYIIIIFFMLNLKNTLLAIREDRTRGGRSTYQCSYTLPASLISHPELRASSTDLRQTIPGDHHNTVVKLEPTEQSAMTCSGLTKRTATPPRHGVPPLLQVNYSFYRLMCIHIFERKGNRIPM